MAIYILVFVYVDLTSVPQFQAMKRRSMHCSQLCEFMWKKKQTPWALER